MVIELLLQAICGLIPVVVGLSAIFARDWWWQREKRRLEKRGKPAERTPAWDQRIIIAGAISIGLGVLFLYNVLVVSTG